MTIQQQIQQEAERKYPDDRNAEYPQHITELQDAFTAGSQRTIELLQPKLKTVWEWVECSEELPENGATVIWKYVGGGHKEGRYQREGSDGYIYFDETSLNHRKHVMVVDAFTHWLRPTTTTP
jgi:hypothetical protein